jgi:hypothetical protein
MQCGILSLSFINWLGAYLGLRAILVEQHACLLLQLGVCLPACVLGPPAALVRVPGVWASSRSSAILTWGSCTILSLQQEGFLGQEPALRAFACPFWLQGIAASVSAVGKSWT